MQAAKHNLHQKVENRLFTPEFSLIIISGVLLFVNLQKTAFQKECKRKSKGIEKVRIPIAHFLFVR